VEETKQTMKKTKESQDLSFELHTIIMLVGPDGASKSLFSQFLANKLRESCLGSKKRIKTPIISYDNIAFELLGGYAIEKDSLDFERVKDKAEELLFAKIKALASYSIGSDFIIIDYNSLNPEFREKVIVLAEEVHYKISAITFDFDNRLEYKNPLPFQLKAMKRVTSGGMPTKLYDSIYNIFEYNSFYGIKVEVTDINKYQQSILEGDCSDYFIIGDIHGCYDEFISLIKGEGFIIDSDLKVTHPNGKKILLVGDLVDKGRDIAKVIEIAYANIGVFIMTIGNHESFVYRVLKNLLPGTSISDIMKKEYFQSIDLFKANEELRNKFFSVVESMREFYVHRDFLVTHAPCDDKFIGKLSATALRSMRDFKYPKTRDFDSFAQFIYEFDEILEFMKKQSSDVQRLHIFGHIVTSEVSRFKNKIAIDTGCASGGKLTGIYVLPHGRIKIKSEQSLTNKKEDQKFYNFF